jgi:hypothetical protein
VLKNRELHNKQIEKINLEKTLKELTISVLESEKAGRSVTIFPGNRRFFQKFLSEFQCKESEFVIK